MHLTRRLLAADERDRRCRHARFRTLCQAVLADTLADFEGLWWESRGAVGPAPARRTRNRHAHAAHRLLHCTEALTPPAIVQRLKPF